MNERQDESLEPSFEQFAAGLRALGNSKDAIAYANHYVDRHRGMFPIIEGHTAHFLFAGDSDALVGIHGEWNGGAFEEATMTHLGAGLLHYQHDFELDARLDYLIALRTEGQVQLIRDPLNARIGQAGMGLRSELAMPAYRRPFITQSDTSSPKGSLVQGTIKSKALRQQRAYTVYLPHGYTERHAPYPTLYFHDGNDYLTMGETVTILDNIIAQGKGPAFVAVFVSPIEREREYNCSDVFTSFFCDELVPEMQRLYQLDPRPERRCIIGPSMGGLISLYIASQRPDTFRSLYAQSTVVKTLNGLGKYDACTAFAVQPRLPLRLALVIGSYEDCFARDSEGRCRDLLTPVRKLRGLLNDYGYPCFYQEWHQSHSWGLWRDTLADGLLYLLQE